jgi:hypothetical protein
MMMTDYKKQALAIARKINKSKDYPAKAKAVHAWHSAVIKMLAQGREKV